MRSLVRANGVLFGLLVAHASEHVLRVPGGPGAIPGQLWVAVAMLSGLVLGSLLLSIRADERAPRFAIAAGAASVIAPLAGHVVPFHSALSQPFWGAHVDLLSWTLLLAVAVGGTWLVLAGLRATRACSTQRSALSRPPEVGRRRVGHGLPPTKRRNRQQGTFENG